MEMRTYPNKMHLLILMLFLGLMMLAGCSQQGNAPTENFKGDSNRSSIIYVKLARPITLNSNSITLSGLVEATQRAEISTRLSGYIRSIRVGVGDKVTRGDVLCTISADELRARQAQARATASQAQAAFENAKKDRNRFMVLDSQQSATKKELDNATLGLKVARAQLDAARQTLKEALTSDAYSVLRAPFSGTVTHKFEDEGSMALPGAPILSLQGSANYRISALAPENVVRLITRGSQAEIGIKALGQTLYGTVDHISQSSTSDAGQYLVQIALEKKAPTSLFGGMFADVRLNLPERKGKDQGAGATGLYVPAMCIKHNGQLTGLFSCSSDGHALLHWVRLGKTRGDLVEVVSGLGKNDSFIVSSGAPLTEGSTVIVTGTVL